MKIQSNMYINNPNMTSRNIEKKENGSHALVQEDDIQISDSARKLVETARNKVSDCHTMHFSSIDGEIREIPAEYKCENLFGLRISEFCGLTLSDIDFEEKQISVNHQLQRTRGMKYIIEDTKTSSGTRIIPMTEEVYECFKRIVENRKKPKKEPVIDEYKGFLFLDKKDMPEVALHWEKHFEWALAKHNRIYKEQLPKITPHVCRHTYCSNMAKSGMNPKTLQYLMGHSDIGVTLNTYTHLGAEDAKEELGKYAKMA